MRKIISIFIFSLIINTLYAGSRLEHHKMPVTQLNGVSERVYTVLLPESYDSDKDRSYPVLYLLHGGGDCHLDWAQKGALVQTVDRMVAEGLMEEMIIICPEGRDGCMIWFNMPGWNYTDYFFKDLIPYMEKTYRIRAEKRYRSVAGLSMGGGGATVYGLMHPELFNVVFNMSGYLRRQDLPFAAADPQLEARQKCVEDHNPIKTVEASDALQQDAWRTVRWFVDCGDQDFTLDANMDFVKALRAKNIPYQMRVRKGTHEWQYWQESLEIALRYITENM